MAIKTLAMPALTINDLPNEILCEISSYLGIDNIPFSLTCKRMNEIVEKKRKEAEDIIAKIKLGKN
jgi:hypothetical protein